MREGQDGREGRTAIIVITDEGDVRLEFAPRLEEGEDSLRAHVGFVGFMAARRALDEPETNQPTPKNWRTTHDASRRNHHM